jgi:hypothetical protein
MSRFHVARSLSLKSTSAKLFAAFAGYCPWITGYHQTCRQVFDEITIYIAKSSFTMVFATFVNYRPWIAGSGLDERNVHSKDVVIIHNHGVSAQYLRCFAPKMESALAVQFVDEDSKKSLLPRRRQLVSEASITKYIQRSRASYLYDRSARQDGHSREDM